MLDWTKDKEKMLFRFELGVMHTQDETPMARAVVIDSHANVVNAGAQRYAKESM